MFKEQAFPCGQFSLSGATGPAAGPPMLFLHGLTRRWQDFATLMPSVALRWSVCAVDFRGHGKSDRAGRYLVADHLNDVLAFMAEYVKEPAVLYGHSLGALVAAGVAAAAPQRVLAVILEDPPAESLLINIRSSVHNTLFMLLRSFAGNERPVAEIARDLGSYLMPLPNASPRGGALRDVVSIRFMAKSLKECDPEVVTPVLDCRWLDGYDVEGVFKNVRCPALLLRGDEACGGMLAKSEGERLLRLLSDGTLIEWPGTGHLIHWQQPDATARFVTGFLESL